MIFTSIYSYRVHTLLDASLVLLPRQLSHWHQNIVVNTVLQLSLATSTNSKQSLTDLLMQPLSRALFLAVGRDMRL